MNAVWKDILSTQVPCSIHLQWMFVLLSLKGNQRLLLNPVYIPLDSPHEKYRAYGDAINKVITSADFPQDILLLGNINLPLYILISSYSEPMTQASNVIAEVTSLHSLYQVNQIRKSRWVILDLVFSNNTDLSIFISDDQIIKPVRHHPPLPTVLDIQLN